MSAVPTEAPAPVVPEFPDVDADGYLEPSVDELAAQSDAEMFGEQDADLDPLPEGDDVTDTRSDGEAAGYDEALAEQADAEASQEVPEPEPPAERRDYLTDDEKVQAEALRRSGSLLKEVADRLPHVTTGAISRFLRSVPQGKPTGKSDKPKREAADKAIPTADWPTFIQTLPAVAGAYVAWVNQSYCMVRVREGYPAGVPKGKVISAQLPYPWATVCGHGSAVGATKGSQARELGKNKLGTWCAKCAAGEPMQVGSLPKATTVTGETVDLPVLRIDLSDADNPVVKAVEDAVFDAEMDAARHEPAHDPFFDLVLRDEVSSRRIAQGPDLAQMLADAEAAAHQEAAERLLAAKAEAGSAATAQAKADAEHRPFKAAPKATRKRTTRKPK